MNAPLFIPRHAPFDEDALVSLERALAPATPAQRAWLAGFLAGLDAHQAAREPQIAAPARAAAPLTILFASESGNCERLAHDMAKRARKRGFKPKVIDFADLETGDLAGVENLVVVAATWGEGEPPGRAARAYADLMGDGAPRLDGARFAVLALGDTAYAEFCAIGRAIDARLEALGASRAAERADLDLDFEAAVESWIAGAIEALAPAQEEEAANVVSVDFAARASDAQEASREPIVVEARELVNLNSSRSGKETIHLALGFDGVAPAHEPGDSLELFAENDPRHVDEILVAAGVDADDALRGDLVRSRDVTTLTPGALDAFVAATGHAGAKALVDSGGVRDWIASRQLIDLLETFPARLDAQALRALTRPLPPRAYSIASSRKEFEDEAHLLIAAVRYEAHGRARSGVASTHVADRLRVGADIRVRLKPNRHFRLPAPDSDVIMVGPGTGVAPFRAFVQERRAVGAPGRNWLFFGDRSFTHDFLYQLEWQEALADGSLSRLDLAFSRDAPAKVYVQHRLHEARRDLVEWLDGGASFYVCGDAKAMARDVRAALVGAFADVKALSPEAAEAEVAALERGRRYLQDVY
ncbi:MAG: sulfite reductase subunit alpha [Salinarimonadaceae bacterium]|nr:MAG: sulfite reductase subunit alpha [Salinarimonadaceae bacterium]